MLLYDSFTIALRYSVKLPFSQFARVGIVRCRFVQPVMFGNFRICLVDLASPELRPVKDT